MLGIYSHILPNRSISRNLSERVVMFIKLLYLLGVSRINIRLTTKDKNGTVSTYAKTIRLR